MTYREAFDQYKEQLLERYDAAESVAIVARAFLELCHIPRSDFTLRRDENLPSEYLNRMNAAMKRLMTGEPLQYVIGYIEFHHHFFKVGPGVLIPRPETEELVQWIIEENKSRRKARVLDIGTGTGCIAITLQKQLPEAKVYGFDISTTALAIARGNAEKNHATVQFSQKNILDFLHHPDSQFMKKPFDIIASNPPYIPLSERKEMESHVKDFEPAIALFVSDEDPLIFYRAIFKYAKDHLSKNGAVYLEIHIKAGEPIMEIARDAGFQQIMLRKDSNGMDRMIKAMR